MELKGIFPLRTIPDADAIKSYLESNKVNKTCIVGGGYIGVEIAENLAHLGISATMFEIENSIMPGVFDSDMSGPYVALTVSF